MNPDNKDGTQKAAGFQNVLGYNQSNADDLLGQIKEKLPEQEVHFKEQDDFGWKYYVDLSITGPNGNTTTVRTGWILDYSLNTRLTTLYVKGM